MRQNMASTTTEAPSSKPRILTTPTHKKLSRLSSDQKISKRPLLHPSIAHKNSSSDVPKVVYISSKSSFICTIKRVRSLLNQIEKASRDANGTSLLYQDSQDKLKASASKFMYKKNKKNENGYTNEEVVMKACGKAIEKGLRLAAWWSTQDDIKVELRTGSVGAVDDIVNHDGVEQESRVRNVSFLEVAVRLI